MAKTTENPKELDIKKNTEEYKAFVEKVGECKGKAEGEADCVKSAIRKTITPEDLKKVADNCGAVCKQEKNPRRITYNGNGRGSLPGLTSNVASFVGSMLAHAANAAATGFI
jgi:hypothetical protein